MMQIPYNLQILRALRPLQKVGDEEISHQGQTVGSHFRKLCKVRKAALMIGRFTACGLGAALVSSASFQETPL